MITGVVKFDEPRIQLTIKGRGGRVEKVNAIVDTGYTGSLTLPRGLITSLGLRWQSTDRAKLADGSSCFFPLFEGKVEWDGKLRLIAIHAAEGEPLVGMRLLRGHELKIDVRSRGKVSIRRRK